MSLRQEYLQITHGDRNVGQQMARQAGRKIFIRKLVSDAQKKTAKQCQKRIARTTCRRNAPSTHQDFKSRPIQNHFGVVKTKYERTIKHWAENKQRRFGLKGISHDTNIISLSPISETYQEGSLCKP